ncbi:hypothetical protein J2Z48_001341 [Croceifilum oryzae]|uniref:DUF3238 domain-containing protein n=1 Tax=Croceifilum oryzae TaxID=1553429 RepID=A0AAJ1TJI5_9BACL|nr:DUF3238 domain-containing protein [Croceifilum oryzae]MDQ0417169.1 hypothetical protein [Croceifilum oryzae]
MANIVKIRASVFIPMSWTEPRPDGETENMVQFEGDSREFTPYAGGMFRSRIEQEVVVDFEKREIFSHESTGITAERLIHPDGSFHYRKGRASTEKIKYINPICEEEGVHFQMTASAGNPLHDVPPVDYLLTVYVKKDGTVEMTGEHDGFPCYEFYKQTDFGPFVEIYTHDFRQTGDTPATLDGDMEYKFHKVIS